MFKNWLAVLSLPLYLNAQELTLAWEDFPKSYDTRYVLDLFGQNLDQLIHCSLVDFDPKGNPIPYLAESWTWNTPKELSIKLRSHILFSDGSPVTEEDVVATYHTLIKEALSPRANGFSNVENVSKGSKPGEVLFTLKEPDAPFITNLVLGILPKTTGKAQLGSKDHKKTCGAFLLDHVDLNQIRLKKNPQYSFPDKPKLDTVVIKVVKDEATRFAKLEKGEVDLLQNNINHDQYHNIKKKHPNWTTSEVQALKTTYIGFYVKDPILKEEKVRKAIALAIHKTAIMDHLLKNLAVPASTLLPKGHVFFNDQLKAQVYDAKAAEKLLDEAGFVRKAPHQERFTLSYKTTTEELPKAVAMAVASELKKVGINIQVETLEWGRFKEDVEKGKVQLWGLKWLGFKDPDIYRYAFATGSIPPNGSNRGRFENSELDKLLDQGQKEVNQEKRKVIYNKVQELVQEKNPYIFLWHENNFAVMREHVQNFQVYADGRYNGLRQAYKNEM